MDYEIVDTELEGYPFKYLDRDIVGRITCVVLSTGLEHSNLQKLGNSVAPNFEYKEGTTTTDGYVWFGCLEGKLNLRKYGIPDEVRIVFLFPQLGLETIAQRSVSIYTDIIEIQKPLVKRLADNLSEILLRINCKISKTL